MYIILLNISTLTRLLEMSKWCPFFQHLHQILNALVCQDQVILCFWSAVTHNNNNNTDKQKIIFTLDKEKVRVSICSFISPRSFINAFSASDRTGDEEVIIESILSILLKRMEQTVLAQPSKSFSNNTLLFVFGDSHELFQSFLLFVYSSLALRHTIHPSTVAHLSVSLSFSLATVSYTQLYKINK